jgi:hypothetical protein
MKHILTENGFLTELQKLAVYNGDLESASNSEKEPMVPDLAPKMTQEAASDEQNKDEETKEAELQAAKDEIEREKEASEHDLLSEKIASALPEFGALARLYDWAQGGDTVNEQVYKEASHLLDEALTSEEKYAEHITRVAEELFTSDVNREELYSESGMQFVFNKLSDFLGNEDLQKEASEDGSFMQNVFGSMGDFVNSVGKFFKDTKNLAENAEKLKAENVVHNTTLAEYAREKDPITGVPTPRGIQLLDQLDASPQAELVDSVRNGRIGQGLKWGGLAAGALYGGHKLYQGLHSGPSEEQVAYPEDKGLLSKVAGGTLMEEYRSETGGMAKMNNKSIVQDFLKIAGAAALIQTAQDANVDAGLRKEASDAFDEISLLGRSEMGAAFIKVAQEAYTEQELHEIVAGKHTPNLLNKVAFFLQADEMSADELYKVAGASGVATKGVGGALSDAASNIESYIDTAKANAEGAGREYVGVVKGAEGKGDNKGPAGTGQVGGQIVANNMAGYNVINNPGEYDVEQTAAMIEEASLAKQAAYDTYHRADKFLKHFAGLLKSN